MHVSLKILAGLILFLGTKKLVNSITEFTEQPWTLRQLVSALTGAIFGLICSNLLILPSAFWLGYTSEFHLAISSVISLVFMGMFSKLFVAYEPSILKASIVRTAVKNTNMVKILDTNTIMDCRIFKLAEARFVEGMVVIPGFVLDEIKRIADDHDEMKRQRGKHALKIVNRLLEEYDYIVRYDTQHVTNVDNAILELAQNLNGKIITCDANLIELAKTKNVSTININELAIAFQMVHLHGEKISVKIVEEGKSSGQGVGYTRDGTMIVVENGEEYINETIDVMVTKHLQGSYGVVLFARTIK